MKTAAVCVACAVLAATIAMARDSVSAREVTGTFAMKSGSEFKIESLGAGKLRVEFKGICPYLDAHGDNTADFGFATGTATIEGDEAIFRPDDYEETCTIRLEFTQPGVLKVEQQSSDCGFGHHCGADGTYRKTSSGKPKFGEDN